MPRIATKIRSLLGVLFALASTAIRLGAQPVDTGTAATAIPIEQGAPRDSLPTENANAHCHPLRLALIGGLTAGGFLYGHVVLSHLWWKGEPSSFHFNWDNDWRYSLGADKLGHAFFPYLAANIYDQALLWGGLDSATSILIASSGALAYQTYIEIRDGFSKEWGFSWGDWGADLFGAALPLAQRHSALLRAIDFKMSFYPSPKFKAGMYKAIIDDYESSYHWLSIDVHDLLPEAWRSSYPAFVNVAIGHSVQNLDGLGGGQHQFYLSLDWNLKKLPGEGWFLNLLKRNLDYYHLPAPAIRISPGVVWYGLHF